MPRIEIFCQACRQHLFSYFKRGKGLLVKIQLHRIIENHTGVEPPTGVCPNPNCAVQYGRPTRIRGRPVLRVIGNKVYSKGH